MAVQMTPLPIPPTRQDPANFSARGDAFLGALPLFQTELNDLALSTEQIADDAAASAEAAALSATTAAGSAVTAGQQVTLAQQQVALANAERQGANAAKDQAQIYAAAAGAAAGLPALAGNGGKNLRAKLDETGVEWANAGQLIGDVLITARSPDSTYLEVNGSVYLQSAYPELFAEAGLINGLDATAWNTVSTTGWTANAKDELVYDEVSGVMIMAPQSGGAGVYRSTDNGITWSSVSSTSANFGRLATDNNGVWIGAACTIAGSSIAELLRSTDNGLNFSRVNAGFAAAESRDIATDGNGVWIAVGNSGKMFRSTDDGASWSAVTSGFGTNNILSIDCDRNGVWVAGDGVGVRRSTDNGITWSAVSLGVTMNTSQITTNRNGAWVASGGSTANSRTSTDNGITWSAVVYTGSQLNVNDIKTDRKGTFVMATSGGFVVVSRDDGRSWVAIPTSGSLVSGAVATDTNGTWWAAVGNTLMRADKYYEYDQNTQFQVPRLPQPEGVKAYIKAVEA